MSNDVTPISPQCSCPVEITLRILGGKWKGVIIYRLLKGTRRFNQLKREIPSITHRMLSLQLRSLEEDGIVQRVIFAEVPPRVEYSLTDLGRTMSPIIDSIYDWGKDYSARFVDDCKPQSESATL